METNVESSSRSNMGAEDIDVTFQRLTSPSVEDVKTS